MQSNPRLDPTQMHLYIAKSVVRIWMCVSRGAMQTTFPPRRPPRPRQSCVWCEPQVLLAKSQTVRSFLVERRTKSYLGGSVPVQKSLLELSQRKGTQPASSGDGRRRRGQARTGREGSRFSLAWVPSAHTCRSMGQEVSAGADTVSSSDTRGDWRSRLLTRADNTDR